jgi:hypothetical protein
MPTNTTPQAPQALQLKQYKTVDPVDRNSQSPSPVSAHPTLKEKAQPWKEWYQFSKEVDGTLFVSASTCDGVHNGLGGS